MSSVENRVRTKVVIFGGTGFVGNSLRDVLELLRWDVTYLSRYPLAGQTSQHQRFDLLEDSPRDFDADVFIHAATPASASLNSHSPLVMFHSNVRSMEKVIEIAQRCSKPPIVLFTSSGAVYGEIPNEIDQVSEACRIGPSTFDLKSAYGEGKRVAELLLAEATYRGVCRGIVARLFTFSGIHLPLDRHFAIGNFVNDVAHGRDISVRGDGTAVRSYLDGKDMAEWLIAAIEKGVEGVPYHVGSEDPITILELAELVAARAREVTKWRGKVLVSGQRNAIDGFSRYVPETSATRLSLSVDVTVSLGDSIDGMLSKALKERDGVRM